MREKILFVGSDTHCGSRIGLTPPAYSEAFIESEQSRKAFNNRKALWEWFTSEVDAVLSGNGTKKFDASMWNGDLVEGKGKRSGGTELITSDMNEQTDIAAAVISRVPTKKIYMTYGTPYHTGTDDDWEVSIKDKVGAVRLEGEGHYDINGLQVAMKHHIGNSSSPVSKMTAMVSAQVKQQLWAAREQQPKANLIIRSHIHRCYYVGEPGTNWSGWTTPALQGLGSKYGIRRVDGLPVEFGFLVVRVKDVRHWSVEPHISPLKMQACSVEKI